MADQPLADKSIALKPFREPFDLFERWFEEASRKEPNDANAMALATVGPDGQPSLRMVLLKEVDERGFTFYTNCESRKGRQLLTQPKAALDFHWKSLRRQVRIEGPVELVAAEEADRYFATRPRTSQIGAWASDQSRPMTERLELEKRVAQFTAKFGFGTVPRPPHWSGFRVVPHAIEFWIAGAFRLHDRRLYEQSEGRWRVTRLYP